MNQQEIFDTVAKHLFEQGEQSTAWDEDFKKNKCRYRDGIGKKGKVLKCAVGVLIPDEDYDPAMENGSSSVNAIMANENFKNKLPAYFATEQEFLYRLQRVHDIINNWHTTTKMIGALTEFAKMYNLNTDVLEGLKFDDR
jgi:hypothetical protein